MPQERSAEWLRGRLGVMIDKPWWFSSAAIEEAQRQLAEAEAREAGPNKGHKWELKPSLLPHPFCRVCGVVQRKDGQNSPCKGPTAISTREASAPTSAEADDDLHRQIQSQTGIIACHLDFEELLMRELFESKFGDKSMDDTLKAVVSLKQQLATAAEVIAAAERALKEQVRILQKGAEDCECDACTEASASATAGYTTLAAIAKWKEDRR